MIPRLAPIIDLRADQPLHRRLPTELATLGLWGAWGLLLGGVGAPLALVSVAALWRLGRSLRRPSQRAGAIASSPPPRSQQAASVQSSADQGRGAMAEHFGLREVDLFRAQHASICTLHHDLGGAIVKLDCRERLGAPLSRRLSAHLPIQQPAIGRAPEWGCDLPRPRGL